MSQQHPTPQVEFERPRDVYEFETRTGYAHIHIHGLEAPLQEARIRALEGVARAGVSIDFLKLTQSGMAFLVAEEQAQKTQDALSALGLNFRAGKDYAILIVHSVNMRDENGRIAKIVSIAIGTGARIDHLSDMHDRVLIVTPREHASGLAEALRATLSEAKG
ncbi:MAG: hypothetical protein QY327_10410 [Fimbriimonadaceae bacterium]|nr:hypothetical protein [Fimbriimonadaceae bacterium]MCZ7581702.1 hypothetical protein [Fimbriimonadaceae bacterium]QOJ10848.1 MAG: hypothetical protein HRU74_01825 [Chthonomonadaceae bacterium]WKZ79747.1 MAG: hypothetical protein QY327_10410 [Fimbriimonadaceae bacterium]